MASLDQYSDTPRRVPGSSAKAPNKANFLVTGFAALVMSACANGPDVSGVIGGLGDPAQRLTEQGGKNVGAGVRWGLDKGGEGVKAAGSGFKWGIQRAGDGVELVSNGLGWTIQRLADGTEVLVDASGVILGYGVKGTFKIVGAGTGIVIMVVRNVGEGTLTAFAELGDRTWTGINALSFSKLF